MNAFSVERLDGALDEFDVEELEEAASGEHGHGHGHDEHVSEHGHEVRRWGKRAAVASGVAGSGQSGGWQRVVGGGVVGSEQWWAVEGGQWAARERTRERGE